MFSELVSGMIREADGELGKLVNGSMGEWCSDTGNELSDFLLQLFAERGFPRAKGDVREKITGVYKSLEDHGVEMIGEEDFVKIVEDSEPAELKIEDGAIVID